MKVISGTKKRRSIVLRVAVLIFSAYMLVMLAQLRMEIDERQKQLDEIEDSIRYQQQQNEDMVSKIENYEVYLEQHAREQGMAVPGESIYQEAQGAN
ncbi:MAG: FtsB family cell division protein [Acutalibacteraceae bacterium]|jgi:cell division protein FtsB